MWLNAGTKKQKMSSLWNHKWVHIAQHRTYIHKQRMNRKKIRRRRWRQWKTIKRFVSCDYYYMSNDKRNRRNTLLYVCVFIQLLYMTVWRRVQNIYIIYFCVFFQSFFIKSVDFFRSLNFPFARSGTLLIESNGKGPTSCSLYKRTIQKDWMLAICVSVCASAALALFICGAGCTPSVK